MGRLILRVLFVLGVFLSSLSSVHAEKNQELKGYFQSSKKMNTVNLLVRGGEIEKTLVLDVNGVKKFQRELYGSVESVDICAIEGTGRNAIVVFSCDSGNGPNCQQENIYFNPEFKNYESYHRPTMIYEGYEERDGDFCRWPEHRTQKTAFLDLLHEWRPGAGEDYLLPYTKQKKEDFTAPVKSVSADQLAEGMLKLAPYIGHYIYSETLHEDKTWRIHALTGTDFCDAEGIVIAENLKQKTYQAIYAIPSGCSKAVNYPPRVLSLKNNKMEAEFCTDCSWYGDWGVFEWDLKTHRVRYLRKAE